MSDTGLVQFDPESRERVWPKLEQGVYGPGCEFEAECEIVSYEHPASTNPGYDKEGLKGPYASIEVKVRQHGEETITHTEWYETGPGSGNRMWKLLLNIGVDVAEDGKHDPDSVLGLPVIVEANAPSPSGFNRIKTFHAVT